MKWKQKNPSLKTIKEVVMANTGLSEEELLHDDNEYNIRDIHKVIEALELARKNDTFVTVVGDYDVDGVTSSTEWHLMLEAKKIRHRIRLPRRHTEGYGLNVKIIDEIDDGIVLTVDNGIAALDAIQKAKDKGLYVIIVDHHQPVIQKQEDGTDKIVLPNADIIIDPHAVDNGADFKTYCGAGLTYKIAQQWFDKNDRILQKLVSFAAIGTVSDVMPLVKDNRKIVKEGMYSMLHGGRTIGLAALMGIFNIRNRMTAEDIGFGLGPALNACGRLGNQYAPTEAMQAYDLLTFKGDFKKAEYLANLIAGRKLDNDLFSVNEMRKRLVKDAEKKAEESIINDCLVGDIPLVVSIPDINEGIIGIIAGRLTEKYKIPSICFTTSTKDPDVLKGSGRSVEAVNLKALLDKVSSDMLGYGGHPLAAGLAIKKDNLNNFREHLKEKVGNFEVDDKPLEYDLEIKESDIESLIEELDKFGPYGEGNPQPIFLIKNYKLFPKGNSLYTISGSDNEHITFYGESTKANGFWLREQYVEIGEPKVLNIIGTLDVSFFNGEITYGMKILDMEAVEEPVKKKTLLQEILRKKSEDKNK